MSKIILKADGDQRVFVFDTDNISEFMLSKTVGNEFIELHMANGATVVIADPSSPTLCESSNFRWAITTAEYQYAKQIILTDLALTQLN